MKARLIFILLLFINLESQAGYERISQFYWANLDVGIPQPDPDVVKNTLWELEKRTSIVASKKILSIDPADEGLLYHPFSTIIGEEAFTPPGEKAIKNLRRYLEMGGFLFIDDTSGLSNSEFFISCARMLKKIFPEKKLVPLGNTHVIYRTFFLLKKPFGRDDLFSDFYGILLETRAPVVVSVNNVFGALKNFMKNPFEYQNEMAMRTILNVIMYSMTVNYKEDQVHQPFIINRLRK